MNLINFVVIIIGVEFESISICGVLEARLFEALNMLGVFQIGVKLVVVEVVAEVDVRVDWRFVLAHYLLQRVVALFVVV